MSRAMRGSLMKHKLKSLKAKNPRLYEGAAYLFFGLLTTLVNWLIYLLLTSAMGLTRLARGSEPYLLAVTVSQAVAWIVSVLFAYVTNRRFVFKSDAKRGSLLREMWLFISARVLGYLLFDLLLFSVFLLFMGDQPAKLIMNGFVIVFNYVLSRYVIFKKRKTGENPDRSLP